MIVSMEIKLLFKDTRFPPSGSDISDVCGIFHLHESYAYYIAPTCWLLWELSSSVAGNNSKLLLLVICHPASAIIYVHGSIVFWPRGHFVCLKFQLYDARSREPPPMPSDPNLAHTENFFFKCMFCLPLQVGSVRCTGIHMAFLLTESEEATYEQTRMIVIGVVNTSEEPLQKGMSLITAVWRGLVLPARPPLRPPPTAGQGGREKSLT